MDNNEFSFDNLLKNDSFIRYESIETRHAMSVLFGVVEKNVKDEKAVDMILDADSDYSCCCFKDGFKHGFCFALKAIKFMCKI